MPGSAQADVEVTLRCINTSIKTVITEGLDDSYDLVYSAGLFDYLKDLAVRAAGARVVDALAPGGHAVIGNFDVAIDRHPDLLLLPAFTLHPATAQPKISRDMTKADSEAVRSKRTREEAESLGLDPLPGSHVAGGISADALASWRERREPRRVGSSADIAKE